MKRIFCCLVIMGCFLSFNLNAQFENETVESIAEEIAENSEESSEFESLLDDLIILKDNPVNINSGNYDELSQLFFLTEFQIISLAEYIQKKGPIVSVYEIQYIYGFDNQMVRWMTPFITLDNSIKPEIKSKELFKNGRHNLYLVSKRGLQQSKGYSQDSSGHSAYSGDPNYLRMKINSEFNNKLFIGIQAEKDAGEKFGEKGFDFYSGYLQLKNIGLFKNIIAGDYQLQFGQGLNLWSGFSGVKGFNTTSKLPSGIKKSNSADENKYFRGIAATIGFKNLEIITFYSSKKIDATITDTIKNEISFSAFGTSGLHRTLNEIRNKKSVHETAFGTNINFKKDNFRIGTTFVKYLFNAYYNPAEKIYNKFGFKGNDLTNIGLDYSLRLKNLYFFGEISSANTDLAFVNGLETKLHPLVSFSLIYRKYSRDFYSYRSNAFSEYSSKNNETGAYIGISIFPYKNIKLTAWMDIFKSPWLRYNVNSPSFGKEYFIQVDYNPDKKIFGYVRYKNERKSRNVNGIEIIIPYSEYYTVNKTRLNLNFSIYRNIYLQTRMEWVWLKPEKNTNENGFLIFQDINYKPEKFPISFWLRFSRFYTDSWNSRIYTYENSVPFSFSIPSLSDNGFRTYFMLRFNINKDFSLWIKYSQSVFYNKDYIGSGKDEIPGNKKSFIDCMIKYKF